MAASREPFLDLAGALATEPIERARTIPSAWYTEDRFYDLDLEAVIAATWQHLGGVEALRAEGALAAAVAGRPLIVAVTPQGELRAFHNVCRHRGGPLAPKAGAAGVLQCRYHGWTYRTDGSLLGTPHFGEREALDPARLALPPVAVETWEGQVFVSLAPDLRRPASLAVQLAGLAERLAGPALGELRFARRASYEVCCNWKVYVDNYLEGYHVPHVHPELMALYDFRRYRTELYGAWSLQVGPLSDEPSVYSAGGGEALYAFLFPNFMLNALPGRLQTNRVVPLAADRCRVDFEYYYSDVAAASATARIEADLAFSDLVQRQDIEICERIQQGLASPAYDRGRFCVAMEAGVHHFQELLKAHYREWLGLR